VTMIQKIEYKKQKISSTLIRELITSGNVDQIPLYIGKHYEVRGFIESKTGSEKKIVNEWLRMNVEREYLLPKPGMYIISLETEEELYKGICYCTSGNHLFIQVQASTCEEMKKEKFAKVKWIRFLSSPKLFSEAITNQ
jgi:riboflavin kinase/FMN adenylyltransferase